jgi:hypothetical protein
MWPANHWHCLLLCGLPPSPYSATSGLLTPNSLLLMWPTHPHHTLQLCGPPPSPPLLSCGPPSLPPSVTCVACQTSLLSAAVWPTSLHPLLPHGLPSLHSLLPMWPTHPYLPLYHPSPPSSVTHVACQILVLSTAMWPAFPALSAADMAHSTLPHSATVWPTSSTLCCHVATHFCHPLSPM